MNCESMSVLDVPTTTMSNRVTTKFPHYQWTPEECVDSVCTGRRTIT